MNFMTLTRIRRGFATNSSSTHSILEVESGQNLPAPLNFKWDNSHGNYDDFVVSDRLSRICFLHAMAADAARDAGDQRDDAENYRRYLQLAAVIPGDPLNLEDMRDNGLNNLSGYAVPRKIHTRDMDVDFFERVVRFVMSENVIVYGGWGFQPWDETLKGEFRELLGGIGMVSRRVGEDEWTLLCTYDGKKYSVKFDADGRQKSVSLDTPLRAMEIADVSISNACRRQCSFCYRDSIPDGKSADIENLYELLNGLKDADAMEMVIGGGEPTEHPDFYRFLKDADFGDICVSFTTRDLDFVRSLGRANGIEEAEVIETIRKKVKAIGISVRTVKDVNEAQRNLAPLFSFDQYHGAGNPQMVFHVIPEPGWQELFDVLNEHKLHVLILGMKFTGRNSGADKKAYANTLEAMLKDERIETFIENRHFYRRVRLGVDTKFIVDAASVDPNWLKRFRRASWSDVEGERSVFIDMVDRTMAPCSFGGKKVKLGGYGAGNLLNAFDAIGTYRPEKI